MALKPVLPSSFVNVPNAKYNATLVARVDAVGDDSTGVIGNLLKPFKTVAGAAAAFEALSPSDANCTFLINDSLTEDVTTSLQTMTFVGNGTFASTAFGSLTLTETTNAVRVFGVDCGLGSISGNTSNNLTVDVSSGGIAQGNIVNSGGGVVVNGAGAFGSGGFDLNITGAGAVAVGNLFGVGDNININTTGDVSAYDCLLNNVTAGGDVYMYDSRFKPGGTLAITGDITFSNALLFGPINPLPLAPTDEAGIIQLLADTGLCQQPL